MNWTFASTSLKVAIDPIPVCSEGSRKIMFQPPGYNGISAVIPDGLMETRYTCTVLARTYAEMETLRALFRASTPGDLEIEHDTDAWVYADAYVEGEVVWEYSAPETWIDATACLYRARVTFVCPDPVPTWKTSGLDVF